MHKLTQNKQIPKYFHYKIGFSASAFSFTDGVGVTPIRNLCREIPIEIHGLDLRLWGAVVAKSRSRVHSYASLSTLDPSPP